MEKTVRKGVLVKLIALVLLIVSALTLFGGCQLADRSKSSLTSVAVTKIEYNASKNTTKISLLVDFDNSTIWNINGVTCELIVKDELNGLSAVELNESNFTDGFFVRHGNSKTFNAEVSVSGNIKSLSAYNLISVKTESFWQTYKVWYISIFCLFGSLITLYALYVFICKAEFGEIFSLLDDYGVVGTISVILLLTPLILLFFCEWVNFISILLALIISFVICWFTHYILVFFEFIKDASLNRKERKLEREKENEVVEETTEKVEE